MNKLEALELAYKGWEKLALSGSTDKWTVFGEYLMLCPLCDLYHPESLHTKDKECRDCPWPVYPPKLFRNNLRYRCQVNNRSPYHEWFSIKQKMDLFSCPDCVGDILEDDQYPNKDLKKTLEDLRTKLKKAAWKVAALLKSQYNLELTKRQP